MKFLTLVLSPILCTVVIVGCAGDDSGKHTAETAMNTEAQKTISFEGDFEGPLGLQLWSLRDYSPDDIAARFAMARSMGFEEVETAGTYGMSIDRYRRMLDDAGLDPTSMHSGYERFRDSIDVILDEAEALGVEFVGPAWIPHEGGKPFTKAMGRAAAADFNKWGAAAKARGLQFMYHVHGYEFRVGNDGKTAFDVIVAESDPDAVKFEMDVFWVAHSGTDPAALLRKYPDRWVAMHIKDMKKGTPTPDHSGGAPAEADVPIGTGQIDYPAVLAAAKEIGLARYYVEDESTDPLNNIPKSVAFLEGVTF